MTATTRSLLLVTWAAFAAVWFVFVAGHGLFAPSSGILVVGTFEALIVAITIATLGLTLLGYIQLRRGSPKRMDVALVAISVFVTLAEVAYLGVFFGG